MHLLLPPQQPLRHQKLPLNQELINSQRPLDAPATAKQNEQKPDCPYKDEGYDGVREVEEEDV